MATDKNMAEATAKPSSLQQIITCSICLEVLNKPVIFPCIHHFCKTCKEQLKKARQGEETGILCPLCQQFASDEAIKDDFVMEQIINVHTKNSTGANAEVYCDFCTTEKSTHNCLECKSTLCERCKKAHTRIPTCKGHTIKPLDGTVEAVIDSVVFCSIHTDKIVEFNCGDCNKALCYRCKILDHDGHRTQTIEGAIASILPTVQKKLEPIQNDIAFLNKCIANLNDIEAATMNKQQKCVHAVESQQVQLQLKLESDWARLNTEVRTTFQAKIKEIQMQRSDLGHLLSSKESITSRADTLLSHLKDVNLLLQLQGDLMTTLDQHQECGGKIRPVPPLSKDLQYVHHEDNMVATFIDEGQKVLQQQQGEAEIKLLKMKLAGNNTKYLAHIEERDGKIQRLEAEKCEEVLLRRQHHEYGLELDNKVKKLTLMTQKRNTVLGECQKVLQTDPQQQSRNQGGAHAGYNTALRERYGYPSGYGQPQGYGQPPRLKDPRTQLIQRISKLINEPIDF